MKNVTMKDIAQKLHISTVTVSKALSGKDGVGDVLRDRVIEVAEEMGYRYNSMAKNMKEGKSYNIGVIIADRFVKNDADSFYLKMYQNVVKALSKKNYYGIMEIVTAQVENNLLIPNILQENKVDGVIIIGQLSTSYLKVIKNTSIPMVFLDFYDETLDVDSVISDSFYGSYTITNHVISNGHRNVGFVGNIFATSSILDRYLGYYKALISNNIPINNEWIIPDRGDDGINIDYVLPDRLPTAFVCNCDSNAYRLIKKLNKMGYRVPEDITVVGYDNDIFASISSPKLTTVEVDVEAMAETAVSALMRKIQGDDRNLGIKVISGNLILRESVKNISVSDRL